jgi:hypothetical protein
MNEADEINKICRLLDYEPSIVTSPRAEQIFHRAWSEAKSLSPDPRRQKHEYDRILTKQFIQMSSR